MSRVCGVVLAGGKSSRMGRDKAELALRKRRFLDIACDTLRAVTPTVVLSLAKDAPADETHLPLVRDRWPNAGPLGAMVSVMESIEADVYLFHPVDTPNLTERFFFELLSRQNGYDAVVPRSGSYWEPLCALYRRSCLEAMRSSMQAGNRRITSFFGAVRVRAMDAEEIHAWADPHTLFLNVNDPQTYRRLKESHER